VREVPSWRGSRPMILIFGLAVLSGAIAGCSSTTGVSGTTTTLIPTPTTTTSTPSYGPSVAYTLQGAGYQYHVKAEALREEPEVTPQIGSPQGAPPGKEYVVATLSLTNPYSDRTEPMVFTDPSNSSLNLTGSQSGAWAPQFECGFSAGPPSNLCVAGTYTVVSDTASSDTSTGNPQLGPKASAQLVVAFGPFTPGPPLSDLLLYADATPIPSP